MTLVQQALFVGQLGMLTRSSVKILPVTFLALVSFAQSPKEKPTVDQPPIQIVVGPGKEVTVTVPYVSKEDLKSILSTFFGREQPEATKKMHVVFDQASEITIILTSKRER